MLTSRPAGGSYPAAIPIDRRISERLELSAFRMCKVEFPAGASTEPHDHIDDGVEDAYAILRGDGWLVVAGGQVAIMAGYFISVTKGSIR